MQPRYPKTEVTYPFSNPQTQVGVQAKTPGLTGLNFGCPYCTEKLAETESSYNVAKKT